MGWKDWVYGDLVSAADFQSLVQDQTVQRYADTAARTSALGSAVAEGMVSYLDSTNQVEVYDGTGWTGVSSSGSGNAIINGAFDFWQRGTSFTNPGDGDYTTDRWRKYGNGTGRTVTISQQTFTPGTAPVSGYEGKFFIRIVQSVAGSGASYNSFTQRIEDVRTFAGQTVTVSFWAKAADAQTLPTIYLRQNFGTGGSTQVDSTVATSVSLTTSWQRFTYTLAAPSIAGKSISATDSYLNLEFSLPLNNTHTIDFWGIQLESGSSATSFRRNAPSIQGELAACQRYYWDITSGMSKIIPCSANMYASNELAAVFQFPQTMRTTPTMVATGGTNFFSFRRNGGSDLFNGFTLAGESTDEGAWLYNFTEMSGTAGDAGIIQFNNAAARLAFSAEL
jgi:hypothetical protein